MTNTDIIATAADTIEDFYLIFPDASPATMQQLLDQAHAEAAQADDTDVHNVEAHNALLVAREAAAMFRFGTVR
jgi:hypothetical protein